MKSRSILNPRPTFQSPSRNFESVNVMGEKVMLFLLKIRWRIHIKKDGLNRKNWNFSRGRKKQHVQIPGVK